MFKYAKYVFLFLRFVKTVTDWAEKYIEITPGDTDDEIKIKRNGVS